MRENFTPEDQVRSFYDSAGWDTAEGNTTDAALWEDLRPSAAEYVKACRLKLLRWIPAHGQKILDAASGPIQYREYLKYSEHFEKRVCVDISQKALENAEKKIGAKGEFVCASILDLPFSANSFDCALSLHTIYHIDRDLQEKAVRELIRVTKPGQPLVIVYANPDRLASRIKRWFSSQPVPAPDSGVIYYFAHPLSWWDRFFSEGSLSIHCWRSLTAQDSRRLIPGNFLGKLIFRLVLAAEDIFPRAAVKFGAYPVIVFYKKPS